MFFHKSVFGKAVIVVLADDEMVHDGDVHDFACEDKLFCQKFVFFAWFYDAGGMIMAKDNGGGFFQEGAFEDHFRVGEGGGASSDADTFCFDESVSLVEVCHHEILFCRVVNEREETLVSFFAMDDLLAFLWGVEAASFSQFECGDDAYSFSLSNPLVLGKLLEAAF